MVGMYRIYLLLLLTASIFGEEWNTVYLASFPRSGNHWVRFLVEEATHIATSSVYRDGDFPHLPARFPWGGYSTDHGYKGNCRYPTHQDPVLIKTHYPYYTQTIRPFPKTTICLIRHPVDAFQSFHLYEQKGKRIAPITEEELLKFISGWRNFYEFWGKQPDVHFIRYEDLQENTALQLRHILYAAGFAFNDEDIERAVEKYPLKKKPVKAFDLFDAHAIEKIKTELADLLKIHKYYQKGL